MKKRLIITIVIAGLLIGGCAIGWGQGKKIELPLMVRDLTIAYIAEKKAGEKIPFEADYSMDSFYPVWNVVTNSLYLNEQVRLIIPFFSYEKINEIPNYPGAIIFEPMPFYRSFHILGTAQTPVFDDDIGVVHINERFILDEWRIDERQMLSTLVHELIHFQRGNFLGGPPNYIHPVNYEANTQSATIEVLAAMCGYKNDTACKAFWDEIYSYSRGSLRMRMRRWHLEQWYYPIADLLWWDDVDRRAADKSLRFWMGDEDLKDELYNIIGSYQQRPWERVVIPGILGTPLDTGLETKCEVTGGGIQCDPSLMPFDDTQDMLGGFIRWLIRSLT